MSSPTNLIARYAKVFLEHAVKNGRLEEVCNSTRLVEEAFVQCPSLIRLVFLSTSTPREQKKEALEQICGAKVSPLLWRFAQLLVDRGQIVYLPDLLRAFGTYAEEHMGIRKAIVTTAVPPTQALLDRFKKQAKEAVKCQEVVLEQRIDPNIIGGYILQVGTLKLDRSMKYQLHVLKTRCMETAGTQPRYDCV